MFRSKIPNFRMFGRIIGYINYSNQENEFPFGNYFRLFTHGRKKLLIRLVIYIHELQLSLNVRATNVSLQSVPSVTTERISNLPAVSVLECAWKFISYV